MFNKKIIFFITMVYTLATWPLTAHAWGIIPGWDEPYNPPAYYSPTTPDPEDSPSPFFYRDLGWNGHKVFDPIRHAKEVLIALQTAEMLQELIKKTQIEILNVTKIPLAQIQAIVAKLNSLTESANQQFSTVPYIETVLGSKIYDDPFKNRINTETADYETQLRTTSDVNTSAARNFQYVLKNSEKEMDAITQLLQQQSKTEGLLQTYQNRNLMLGAVGGIMINDTAAICNTATALTAEASQELSIEASQSADRISFVQLSPEEEADIRELKSKASGQSAKERRQLKFIDFQK